MPFSKPPGDLEPVRQAGRAIATGNSSTSQDQLVDEWRASHAYVLNTFQLLCKRRLASAQISAEFAQRLKRRKTVIDKLRRRRANGDFLIQDVTEMQDFAGCRLIFNDISDLVSFRDHLSLDPGPVKHELVNPENRDRYDYITKPKRSGYRGVHDIFKHYPTPHRTTNGGGEWNGLRVEIQYRTRVQHAWATAVELSDMIDVERTKFEILDRETQLSDRGMFFALCSELMARKYEARNSTFPEKDIKELCDAISELEHRLGILRKLTSPVLVPLDRQIGKHNVINPIFNKDGVLDIQIFGFKSRPKALAKVRELEGDLFSNDPVYVGSEYPTQLRSAYRNYFKDAQEFTKMIMDNI